MVLRLVSEKKYTFQGNMSGNVWKNIGYEPV